MTKKVLYERVGKIAYITFNRPEKLNALNSEMLKDLMNALDYAEADNEACVVILRGAGRAFSVGYDIVPAQGYSSEKRTITEDRDILQGHIDKWLRVYEFPKPVITQIHGFCIAGATMLAICSDITMVSDECRIRWPSLPIGGGLIGTMWTWLIGPKKAKEMSFIAGSELSGKEAHSLGWANHSVPEAKLEEETLRIATAIAATPADLLRIKKLSINRIMDTQGFRTAAQFGAEWDAIAHFSTGATEMKQRIRENGLRDSINWMEQKKTQN